jgi:hypothetical protein
MMMGPVRPLSGKMGGGMAAWVVLCRVSLKVWIIAPVFEHVWLSHSINPIRTTSCLTNLSSSRHPPTTLTLLAISTSGQRHFTAVPSLGREELPLLEAG